jgi:hypothetical protein
MLFGETVAVYFENHTEHTDTPCGQNAEFRNIYKSVHTSQKTHYVSAIEFNQLVLFGETAAVCFENQTEHTDTLCGENAEFCNIYKSNTYFTGNTLRLPYSAQQLNAV